MILAVGVYFKYRSALEYDFRARFGFGVGVIDREEIDTATLTALIGGLLRDRHSHVFAATAGWAYVPSPVEAAFYDYLDVKIAAGRGKNQPIPQPVKRPWEHAPPLEPSRDPEHLQRIEKLNARFGLSLPSHAR